MLAFIDESGDAGRKLARGSSSHLVIAVVSFADEEEALVCDRRIEALRSEMRLSPRFEFHYTDNDRRQREAFLDATSHFDFRSDVFALNKDPAVLTGPGFDYPSTLYKWTVRAALDNAPPAPRQRDRGHRPPGRSEIPRRTRCVPQAENS